VRRVHAVILGLSRAVQMHLGFTRHVKAPEFNPIKVNPKCWDVGCSRQIGGSGASLRVEQESIARGFKSMTEFVSTVACSGSILRSSGSILISSGSIFMSSGSTFRSRLAADFESLLTVDVVVSGSILISESD